MICKYTYWVLWPPVARIRSTLSCPGSRRKWQNLQIRVRDAPSPAWTQRLFRPIWDKHKNDRPIDNMMWDLITRQIYGSQMNHNFAISLAVEKRACLVFALQVHSLYRIRNLPLWSVPPLMSLVVLHWCQLWWSLCRSRRIFLCNKIKITHKPLTMNTFS